MATIPKSVTTTTYNNDDPLPVNLAGTGRWSTTPYRLSGCYTATQGKGGGV